ncbi:MAG: hypothetical protein R2911_38300 [Caldilineaceae bacterium]
MAARQQMLGQVGGKIEDMRKEQTELRGALGTLHAQSSQLHSQAESVTRELAVSQERLRQVQARRRNPANWLRCVCKPKR